MRSVEREKQINVVRCEVREGKSKKKKEKSGKKREYETKEGRCNKFN